MNLRKLYFEYLTGIVCTDYELFKYSKMLMYLFNKEFTYVIDTDHNRAADGVDLRADFMECNGWDYRDQEFSRQMGPCNVLEMMVALAKRCEEGIMGDDDYGDRTGKWFWIMIKSIGLDICENQTYEGDWDDYILELKVKKMLERKFSKDGKGGLFYIPGIREDMRETEIWYQLMYYLEEYE